MTSKLPLLLAPVIITVTLSTYNEATLKSRIHQMKKLANPLIAQQLGVSSLNDVITIMKSMNYYTDTHDYTRTPEETLSIGGGDCEDLSTLSYSLLLYLYNNGIISNEPDIAIAYDPFNPEAHAFTYFYCPKNNAFYVFSNNEVFLANSLEEAVSMLGYSKLVTGD